MPHLPQLPHSLTSQPTNQPSNQPTNQPTNQGGIQLNLGTGASVSTAVSNRAYQINVHGALMSIAWVLLLPLGSLMPRHK